MKDEAQAQVERVNDALQRRLRRPAYAPKEFLVGRDELWAVAEATLTKDVIWRMALSTRPGQRACTEIRSPLRRGIRIR